METLINLYGVQGRKSLLGVQRAKPFGGVWGNAPIKKEVRRMPKPYLAEKGIPTRDLVIECTGGASLGKDFSLQELEIRHAPNEHGMAQVVVKMPTDDCSKFAEKASINDKVKISVNGKSGSQLFFLGFIMQLRTQERPDHSLLWLELADASILADMEKGSASFQNTQKKYQDILNTVFTEGTAKLKNDLNEPIGKMVLQLEETPWEFARRMASRFNVPVISDLTAEKCSVYLGLKDGSGEIEITTSAMEQYLDNQSFEQVSKNYWKKKQKAAKEDFSGLKVTTYSYLYLGDKIKVNGTSYFVRKVFGKLTGGILRLTYDLAPKEAGFLAPEVKNAPLTGRILMGQVKEVKKDLVRVHLIDIDKTFDNSGDTWLPYATAYASHDGSGWYVMPEKEDYVRVLFPDSDEADAFVSSAVNAAPLEKVRDKSFKAPGGKEILLTDNGVEIIAEHQKIFVKLDKDKGVHLVSSKDIAVSADGNLELNAKGKVEILANSSIELKAGSGNLKVSGSQVSMTGNAIKLGD